MTGCFQFKAQITFSLQNNLWFTLKSEKVIWIREIQSAAETPPSPPNPCQAFALRPIREGSGSRRFTGQSRKKELPPRPAPEVCTFYTGNAWPSEKFQLNAFQVWKNSLSYHLPELLLYSWSFWQEASDWTWCSPGEEKESEYFSSFFT